MPGAGRGGSVLQHVLIVVLCGTACSYAGVALLRRWAQRRSMVDIPNERSSHTRPTPRGGGLAIVLAVLLGWPLAQGLFYSLDWKVLAGYGAGAALVALVSWLDDVQSLSNRVRFAAHTLSALIAMSAFGYWHTLDVPLAGEVHLGFAGAILTFLWITGLTNAYNFMDGSDGIAAGQALAAGLGWALLIGLSRWPTYLDLPLLICAGSLGFLGHNWPPARIFMGDVGSAFLGYTFALLPLMFPASGQIPVLGVLFVWPFVFDTAFTFLRRLRKGENVFAAHRSHLYQRLIIAGHSHAFVMFLYTALALVGVAAGLLWIRRPAQCAWGVLSVPVLGLLLWIFVVRQEGRLRPVASGGLPGTGK